MDTSKIKEITKKAREYFENGKIDKKLLKELYQKYNPLENIDDFIEIALKQFPKLNCGLASVYLQYLLGGEIVKGRYGKESHTFLELGDVIIDITADQYGGPKVYVGEMVEPWGK